MIPAVNDGPGRICWLASAIAGAWRWQTPKQREDSAVGLALSYLTFAKRRAEMPEHDMAVADSYTELFDLIASTLNAKANKRICKRVGIPYNPAYHQGKSFNESPF
jgi:hypothetical protein